MTVGERRERRVCESLRVDPLPAKARPVDVRSEQPACLGHWLVQRLPLGIADHDVCLGEFGQSADVVLVQVGDHRGVRVVRAGTGSPARPPMLGLARCRAAPDPRDVRSRTR